MGGLDPALQLRNCPPLEVERRIGEGAFATVHLVERTDVDPMFSKPLALKVINNIIAVVLCCVVVLIVCTHN